MASWQRHHGIMAALNRLLVRRMRDEGFDGATATLLVEPIRSLIRRPRICGYGDGDLSDQIARIGLDSPRSASVFKVEDIGFHSGDRTRLSFPPPPKQTHRAEPGGEKRKRRGKGDRRYDGCC